MLRLRDLPRFRDPRRLWQRLVLYSKRVSPLLRWQEVGDFAGIWPRVRTHTLVSEASAQMLYQLARHASRLDGDMAEIGVYKGGTAKLLAHVADAAGKKLHLFDTFAGMPETDLSRDLHAPGDFGDTSLEGVQRYLREHRSPVLHRGEFPGTAAPVVDTKFALVHVDVDIASSVDACCRFFYPRLVPGGVLVFDDYGQRSCPGAKAAADAYFADKREPVLHLVTGQAIVLKT